MKERPTNTRVRYWVLRAGDSWFLETNIIGPRVTSRRDEAERFKSRRKAMQSPAYYHALSNFVTEAVR